MSSAKSGDFWSETDLSLMPGETLLYTGLPQVRQMKRMANSGMVVLTVFLWPLLVVWPWTFWTNRLSAERHKYFVTSLRVIVTNGLFGYSTRSVPLERISDVQIGCTLLERCFGLRSIVVRDMTGEAHGSARMRGVPDASAVQELILTQLHRVNKVRKEGEAPAAAAAPEVGAGASGHGERRQMIGLLERIATAVERS